MRSFKTSRHALASFLVGGAVAALVAPASSAGAAEGWNYYDQYSGTTPGTWVVADALIRTHSTAGPMDWEQIDDGLPYIPWQCTTTTGGHASYSFGVFQTNLTDSKIVYSVHVPSENVVYQLAASAPATIKWEGALKLDASCVSGHSIRGTGYAYY